MKKVIILTGCELRHDYIRKAIALNNEIEVIRTYCEKTDYLYDEVKEKYNDNFQLEHLLLREQSEKDFFKSFVDLSPDNSNPKYIKRGEINNYEIVKEIIDLAPDMIVAYGCSIIKKPLIEYFKNRFLNVHLGLSPYYRGSGTNFFPLVNGEPQYVGATFMYIDEGIDTGDIIHQIQARIFKADTPHMIGNRLISDIAYVYIDIIRKFDDLVLMPQVKDKKSGRYYKNNDFTPKTTIDLYSKFSNGLIDKYLENRPNIKLIRNPTLQVSIK